MKPIAITACGCVDDRGFGNARSWTPWRGPAPRLRWRTFSKRPFDRFGRLDLLCKYALAAVEMLDLPPMGDTFARECVPADTALTLGTEHGCLDVDVKFWQSVREPGGASPTLFTYTLPSTALGEIAIRARITGPSVCLMAGPESGLLALWEGATLVAGGEVPRCICLGCDAVSAPMPPGPIGQAFAFLVEAEGAAPRPLAALHFTQAEPTPIPGGEPRDALRRLFRCLAGLDGNGTAAALYLNAPATLRSREALVVTPVARRTNGRTG